MRFSMDSLLGPSGLFGLTRGRLSALAGLSVAAAIFEGFGMAMFLPVLEFVEKGQDIRQLAAVSDSWRRLIGIYSALGINVSLFTLLAAAIGTMLIRVVVIYARQVYSTWLSQEIQHTTRSNLFDAYLGMAYTSFGHQSSGSMINVLTTEAQRAAGSFNALFALAANAAVGLGFVAVLLWLSAPLTVLSVAFLGSAGLVVSYYVRHTRRLSHAASGANDRYSRIALDRLGAFRLLKLTATASREAGKTRQASEDVRDRLFWLSKIVASVDLIMEPMILLCGGAILFLAVTALGMSLSEVGLFLLILLRLLPLAKEVLKSRQSYTACVGSIAAVTGAYSGARSAVEAGGGGKSFKGLHDSIRLVGVGFAYDGGAIEALQDVSLEIPAGKVTALVGPSGAGKTTLADVLPRLLVPQRGRILFDGVDATEFDLGSLRREIAFVSQEASLLDDTVRENLRFVRPEAGEDELWHALAGAQAAEFVSAFPNGLDTELGERGTRLSGGQRQRLSLARALLQGNSILVLDEPTSALDYETEAGVQKALAELRARGDRTVIIIAHRLSTIRNADKIIVLQDGRVTEEGMHDELATNEDWYARAAGIQAAAS
jgi:subfamily B ATP-binding cassette protein MsbA